jgi:[acyl-carrier-protein] S-malonyltransferase
MPPSFLSGRLPSAALAFRGYNVTNLGRSAELLAHPAYAGVVQRHLDQCSATAGDVLDRHVDLAARVKSGEEYPLESYGEAVALVLAIEAAQLELLAGHFGIDHRRAKFSFGYSLGEIAALAAGGVIDWTEALRVPLALADDCVALARDITLGVLFTRSAELPADGVRRVCLRVNEEGRGIMGISTYLSPNSVLLFGQEGTLDRFSQVAASELSVKFHLRKNQHRWPPLHTPIVSERHVADRAASLMHRLKIKLQAPQPPVLSLVTADFSYTDTNTRKLLHEWIDHPQLLWNVVERTLSEGITTVIHVGPDPNILPATFRRLGENVQEQLKLNLGLRALSAAAGRRWLASLLPQSASLLRAPYVQHVILEDWLLANAPAASGASAKAASA